MPSHMMDHNCLHTEILIIFVNIILVVLDYLKNLHYKSLEHMQGLL